MRNNILMGIYYQMRNKAVSPSFEMGNLVDLDL